MEKNVFIYTSLVYFTAKLSNQGPVKEEGPDAKPKIERAKRATNNKHFPIGACLLEFLQEKELVYLLSV